MAKKAKQAFQQLASKLISTNSLTLAQYRRQMTDSMSQEQWKMILPWIRNARETLQFKDELKVLGALTDEELEDRSLLKGLRLMRVARQSDKPISFVTLVLGHFDHLVLLQRWLHKQQDLGQPLPTTMEEAQEQMSLDPRAHRDAEHTLAMKNAQRRMKRRGY